MNRRSAAGPRSRAAQWPILVTAVRKLSNLIRSRVPFSANVRERERRKRETETERKSERGTDRQREIER